MCQKGEIKEIVTLRPKRIEQLEQLEQLSGSTFFPPAYIPKRFCSKTAIVHVYLEDLINSNSKLYNPKLYKQYTENDAVIKHEDEEGDLYVIKRMKVPTIQDVVKYVAGNPDQSKLFEPITGCISVYNICER
jgi:hypothetical protein